MRQTNRAESREKAWKLLALGSWLDNKPERPSRASMEGNLVLPLADPQLVLHTGRNALSARTRHRLKKTYTVPVRNLFF